MIPVDEIKYDEDNLVLCYQGREVRVPLPLDPYEGLQDRLLAAAKASGQTEDDLSDDVLVAGLCTVLLGYQLRSLREGLEKMERKVDELIDENDELRRRCGEAPLFSEAPRHGE
jgi:hypothetical protein